MVGLNQNSFFGLSKCYSLGNDFNGILIKFALENIFNGKYAYLGLFISRINVVIGKKSYIKLQKRYVGKTLYLQKKYSYKVKVKKIKKIKSCWKCSIKGWYKFEMLLFVTS